MFTQPVSPPSGPAATTSPTSPSNPSRSSRLRGLSYIRNYTQNHLLSRDHSTPGASTQQQPVSPRPTSSLTRSASYSTSSTRPRRPEGDHSASHRLSLITDLQEHF